MLTKIKYYYYFYVFFFFKYFSFKKFFNLLKGILNFFSKKETLSSFPFLASIDPSNICILKCPLCPTGRGDKGVEKKILDFEMFKKYFDQIKDDLFMIRFYNWGEPFLAKDIFKMIEYSHQNNVGVVINSNLNYIPKNLARKIVESKLDYLMLSIDGAMQASYEKYRVGGNLEKVFKTASVIVSLKKKYQTNLPILHWSFLVNKFNQEEIIKAKIMAQSLGFNLITFLPLSLITKVNEKATSKAKNYWLGYQITSQKGETEPASACYFLWASFNISPNGLVFPCCGIYEDRYAFGNLNKDSANTIWNNQNFKSARRLFNKSSSGRTSATICGQCTWFKKEIS